MQIYIHRERALEREFLINEEKYNSTVKELKVLIPRCEHIHYSYFDAFPSPSCSFFLRGFKVIFASSVVYKISYSAFFT